MRLRRAAVATVAALLALAACGGSSKPAATTTTTATTAPTSSTTSAATGSGSFTPKPIQWSSCGHFDCGTLDVPLDYAVPAGPTITLGMVRQPARDQTNKVGSLLVNNGGPGGSPIEFVQAGAISDGEIRNSFDVIGVDPRGVGESARLSCATTTQDQFHHLDPSPDDPAEQQALEAGAKALADDCAQNAGGLLAHVGTDDVVRDMDTIRAALGEPKLSYLGYSYGTLLGLRYAELFPGNARAIVLDGVVDPTQDFRGFLRAQTVAFERLVGGALGDAAADYDRLAARVETNPIPVGARTVGPSELATAAINASYESGGGQRLRDAIRAGLGGDGHGLLSMNDSYESSVQFAAYAAVECIDSPHPVGALEYQQFADELTQISPRFGPSIANELLPCAFWPAPVHNVVGPVRAHGAPPILVIGTTGDAATPYEQAVRVAQDLEQSALLTVEADGHTSGFNRCAQRATASYLVDGTLPADGTRC